MAQGYNKRMNIIHDSLLITMANQTSEALIVLDSKFNILLFNHSSENVFKCSSDKAIGITFEGLCKKSNIPCFLNIHKKDLSHTTISSEIPTLIHKIKLNWQIQEVSDKGRVFYFIRTVGLEAEANKNEIYQLETLIENMPCNVYWVDKHCKMIDCNQNVLDMLGITREEFRGKTYEELSDLCNWQEGLAQKLKNDDHSVMHSGTPIFGVEDPPIPHTDGSFSNFLTTRVPLRHKDGEIVGIAGISMDVTALKEARAKAEAASQSKDVFIAEMSHDIRTPLSNIMGLSTMMEAGAHNADEKENAHLIHNSGEKLLELLNGILDVAAADNLGEADIQNKSFNLRECIVGANVQTTQKYHDNLVKPTAAILRVQFSTYQN